MMTRVLIRLREDRGIRFAGRRRRIARCRRYPRLMPRRAALSRSMVTYAASPLSSSLLTTSASSGCWRSAASSLGVQVDNTVESALSKVNWYWVRLTVLSSVRSCTGLHVQGDARDVRGLGLQPPDGIGDIRAAFAARFQIDQKATAVQSDVVAVDADEGR